MVHTSIHPHSVLRTSIHRKKRDSKSVLSIPSGITDTVRYWRYQYCCYRPGGVTSEVSPIKNALVANHSRSPDRCALTAPKDLEPVPRYRWYRPSRFLLRPAGWLVRRRITVTCIASPSGNTTRYRPFSLFLLPFLLPSSLLPSFSLPHALSLPTLSHSPPTHTHTNEYFPLFTAFGLHLQLTRGQSGITFLNFSFPSLSFHLFLRVDLDSVKDHPKRLPPTLSLLLKKDWKRVLEN